MKRFVVLFVLVFSLAGCALLDRPKPGDTQQRTWGQFFSDVGSEVLDGILAGANHPGVVAGSELSLLTLAGVKAKKTIRKRREAKKAKVS